MNSKANPASGLSRLQKAILLWLLEQTEYIQSHGNDFQKTLLRFWGVRWSPGKEYRKAGYDWTPVDRAVMSRAVLRLEQRGLLQRTNDISAADYPRRAVCLCLTPEGKQLAKRLTKPETDNVNRSEDQAA